MSTSSSSFHVFSDEGGGTEIQPVLGSAQPSLVIVPQWDTTITTSPYASTLEADANAAIQFFESNFYEPATTTINITFSYGEILGQPIPSIYGAESRWGHSLLYTYAQIRNALSGMLRRRRKPLQSTFCPAQMLTLQGAHTSMCRTHRSRYWGCRIISE